MPQFFLPLDTPAEPETFHLQGPEAFHLVRVLRVQVGQTVTLFDGRGSRFEGLVETIHPDDTVSGKITKKVSGPSRGGAQVHLYMGLLKSSHWDFVLEKGTELGAASFTPVTTPRTVVLLREERAKAKQDRWSRVIMAAAKQCQRGQLPELKAPAEFRDAIKACADQKGSVTVLAWEGMAGSAAHEALGPVLRSGVGTQPVVNLFIGPEGGFSDNEVELARTLGAVVFGLGPRILRAETAAMAAMAAIQYELGGL
jgi:16S rRNA (uracil1498-N3)-methyltransferase